MYLSVRPALIFARFPFSIFRFTFGLCFLVCHSYTFCIPHTSEGYIGPPWNWHNDWVLTKNHIFIYFFNCVSFPVSFHLKTTVKLIRIYTIVINKRLPVYTNLHKTAFLVIHSTILKYILQRNWLSIPFLNMLNSFLLI